MVITTKSSSCVVNVSACIYSYTLLFHCNINNYTENGVCFENVTSRVLK